MQRSDEDTVSDEFDLFPRASFDEVRSSPCPDVPRLFYTTSRPLYLPFCDLSAASCLATAPDQVA